MNSYLCSSISHELRFGVRKCFQIITDPVALPFLMLCIGFTEGLVFFAPIATLYRQVRGVSIAQIGMIEGISLALMMVLEIPWGWVADKIGYKRTLVVCSALSLVSKLIFYKATGFAGFLVERVVMAVAFAGLSGVDYAYITQFVPIERQQRFLGRYDGLSTAGLLCASAVFSLFIRDDYVLSALLTVLSYSAVLLFSIMLPCEPDHVQRQKAGFMAVSDLTQSSYLS